VLGAVMVMIVVIWGLGTPVTKLITAPPLVAVSVRFWLTVPMLWVLTVARNRRIPWYALRHTLLAGILFGANNALVFISLKHASVAILSVILALQPGVVLILAGPVLGEWPTRMHVFFTGVGVLGVMIVVLGGNPAVRGDGLGFVMGIAAMLTFVGYYIINRRVRSTKAVDAIEWMACVTLFAAIVITPFAIATSSLDDYRQLGTADWVYVAFMAVVVGVVGHTTMAWAHRYIPATRSSLALLAMNVVSIAVAWPLHDEPITLFQAAGGVVVLGAVAAVIARPAAVRVVDLEAPVSITDFVVVPPPTT
jgi:drug/metabolite transporter (DMT)-like permease